jgi:hypothetical protein
MIVFRMRWLAVDFLDKGNLRGGGALVCSLGEKEMT